MEISKVVTAHRSIFHCFYLLHVIHIHCWQDYPALRTLHYYWRCIRDLNYRKCREHTYEYCRSNHRPRLMPQEFWVSAFMDSLQIYIAQDLHGGIGVWMMEANGLTGNDSYGNSLSISYSFVLTRWQARKKYKKIYVFAWGPPLLSFSLLSSPSCSHPFPHFWNDSSTTRCPRRPSIRACSSQVRLHLYLPHLRQ